MENLETKIHTSLPNKLGANLTHVSISTFPPPTLYTLHRGSDTHFRTHPLDFSQVSKSLDITIHSKPVALTLHNESPLLACRDGALISLENAEHLGDFTDDDPSRSGVLCAASSPDGCLLLVASPVSVSILDADFEITAELPCDGIASDAQVAWRSDGDFFAVLRRTGESTVGFVADRACKLVKRLELEDLHTDCCLDWEPRPGGMVTVSHGKRVLFLERNGLRHRRSDFDAGRKVTMLRWSVDARALLIFGEDVLDIWMKRNYAWYCKKRLVFHDFVDALWDEDDPRLLRVFSSTGDVKVMRFNIVPSSYLPMEIGPLLAVVHGNSVIFTNLKAGLVPPPMNHGHLKFDAGIEAVCSLASSNVIGCLLADGSFETAMLDESFANPLLSCEHGKGKPLPAIRNKWRLPVLDEVTSANQIPFRDPVLISESVMAVVKQQKSWTGHEMPSDIIRIYRMQPGEASGVVLGNYVADGQITSMCKSRQSPGTITIAMSSGRLVRLSVDPASGDCIEVSRTICNAAKNACSLLDTRAKGGSLLSIVRSEEGRLESFDVDTESSTSICDECISFTVLGEFLVYTTRSNLLFCIPLRKADPRSEEKTDLHVVSTPSSNRADVRANIAPFSTKGVVRPIDRGAVIVGSLQDEISVVLQAPRGNLETIIPRPAVLNKIEKLVECEKFGQAFALCRLQRIDMNQIVDADFPLFLKNVDTFVSQIGVAEHLSVFMTLISGEASKINAVCQAVVTALQKASNRDKLISAVLTGMMRQEPRDFEGALKEVKRASANSKEKGRSAVDYLFVLVKNQELIYEHALGTYDLELASFVAESSQMDPATYHAELTSLRKKEESDRKIAIDLKLERYDKALVHLHDAGRKHFQECVSLCLKHSLYDTALPLFRDEKEIMKTLLYGYGKNLKNEGRFDEAAAVFRQTEDNRSACDCYRLGGRWELAAYCAASSELPRDEKVALWQSIATDLEETGRIVESAQVRANLLGEFASALTLLVEGEEWEAAFELAARECVATSENDEQRPDHMMELTSEVVECATIFKGSLDDNRRKVKERGQRLRIIRDTKQMMREQLGRKQAEQEADSDIFSETTASSVSNLSDITFLSKTSATSLYSTATQLGPLSSAKLEKKALRRKQRESKKRIREGDPREEEAIVGYVRKLLLRELTLQRAEKLMRVLLFVRKGELAASLGDAITEYISECLTLPEDVLGGEKARLEGALKEWIANHRRSTFPSPS